MSEIKNESTQYGPKPTGNVKYAKGLETHEKPMRFNQIFINWLIKKSESKDSQKWIGMKPEITTKVIKGNNAIVPKGTK